LEIQKPRGGWLKATPLFLSHTSLRGIPPFVIARGVSPEAIPNAGIAAPAARNDGVKMSSLLERRVLHGSGAVR